MLLFICEADWTNGLLYFFMRNSKSVLNYMTAMVKRETVKNNNNDLSFY